MLAADYSYVLKNSSDVAANDESSVAVTEAKSLGAAE